MRIARVFPRKTSMSPRDDLAFFGPPTIETMGMDIDAVHVSVTFTWDLEKAEELYEQWQLLGVPVEVGGPAFDDRMGDFTPGMYVREGCVVTSRGCQKDCWFCSVPKCAHGVIRELPICDGYNIMDDNILGTSEAHFRAVIDMLKRQKERERRGKSLGQWVGATPNDVFNWWMEYDVLPGQIDILAEDYEEMIDDE